MVESRKKGKKHFWDVRVLKSEDQGCKVEMMNSGLIGWCPKNQEGKDRLKVGDIVKMECTKCPQKRVDDEPRHSPWPKWHGGGRRQAQPYFSHWLWQEQQASIVAAQDLAAGSVVKGKVFKHVAKGLLIELDGANAPKGMLDMTDISRKMTAHSYVDKMFPVGTEMKLYVVHADKENGRITLSTKEFEDDDHVGWMLSFPERCFKMADEAVARYHQKREAYIAMLQQ
jgi:predicted RNA-binding protein with RPS1 domain